MASFRWVAVDAGGHVIRGAREDVSAEAVAIWLQRQGHVPMRADPANADGVLARWAGGLARGRAGLSAAEAAAVTRELAVMLGAGMDLDRALRYIVETRPARRIRRVMERIRDSLRNGSSFAAALAREPQSFSRLYVGLVRAGEAGGSLAETLERLAALQEKNRKLTALIVSAMIYPAVLTLAAAGSVLLLLTYVLPQFKPLFAQSGVALPEATRWLLAAGDLIAAGLPWGLLVSALLALAILRLRRRPRARRLFETACLALPVIGGLIRETLSARLTRTLGTLLRNGVPLIAALGIVRETLTGVLAVEALDAALENARGGGGLAAPLGRAGLLPTRTIHLLQLGEDTAQLADMALKAAEIDEDHVEIVLQRLVAMLVPAITIIMGVTVAAIISSLLTAMLSINDIAA